MGYFSLAAYVKLARNFLLASLLAIMCANGNAQREDSIVQVTQRKFGYMFVPCGTGFVFQRGFVLTAWHIIEDCPNGTVNVCDHNGVMNQATVVDHRDDNDTDWAVLYVPTLNVNPMKIRETPAADGEPIKCYYANRTTAEESTGYIDDWMLQAKNKRHTTCIVRDGFSGSPVVDSWGRAIGIVHMKSMRTGEMYFVPMTAIWPEVRPLMNYLWLQHK